MEGCYCGEENEKALDNRSAHDGVEDRTNPIGKMYKKWEIYSLEGMARCGVLVPTLLLQGGRLERLQDIHFSTYIIPPGS